MDVFTKGELKIISQCVQFRCRGNYGSGFYSKAITFFQILPDYQFFFVTPKSRVISNSSSFYNYICTYRDCLELKPVTRTLGQFDPGF